MFSYRNQQACSGGLSVEVCLGSRAFLGCSWNKQTFKEGLRAMSEDRCPANTVWWLLKPWLERQQLKTSLIIKTGFRRRSECSFQGQRFIRALKHHWGARSYWKYNNMEEVGFIRSMCAVGIFIKNIVCSGVGFHTSCVPFYLQRRAGLVGCWAFVCLNGACKSETEQKC